MSVITTGELGRRLNVSESRLQGWIRLGVLVPPPKTCSVRLWPEEYVGTAREILLARGLVVEVDGVIVAKTRAKALHPLERTGLGPRASAL